MALEQRRGTEEQLQSEAVLGKYHLIAKLGEGGMAEVFLAVVEGRGSFNKLVVVKRHRSSSDGEDGDDRVRSFLDEAKVSARLNHPNIVQTYDVGEDHAHFIVMEHLDGQPLNRIMKALIRRDPSMEGFSRGARIRIVADLLSGLHHAHELCDYDGAPLRIVHRDVSPQNVFVTYDGAVKVVDFGIAKAACNTTRTETGMMKGKASYMAPEQAMASTTLDRRADVFAAGVILWELLALRRLHDGNPVQALAKLVTESIAPVSSVDPAIPPELSLIVAKAVARNPEDRFATALEMRMALEAWLRSSGEDVRGDELAAAMQSAFSEQRVKLRRQIQEQIQRICGGEGSSKTPATLPAVGPTSQPTPRLGAAQEPTQDRSEPSAERSANRGQVLLTVTQQSVAPPSRSREIALGLAAIAIAAVSFAAALTVTRQEPRGPAVDASAAPASVAPRATTEPAEARSSYAAPPPPSASAAPLPAPAPAVATAPGPLRPRRGPLPKAEPAASAQAGAPAAAAAPPAEKPKFQTVDDPVKPAINVNIVP